MSLKKKCGFGNVFSHTEMRPLLFCVSDTPKTALIYLKNGPNCCVRFNFGGRYLCNDIILILSYILLYYYLTVMSRVQFVLKKYIYENFIILKMCPF